MTRLILASGSPRRHELLARLGLDFDIVVPDVDESVLPGELPAAYVARIAHAKAAAVATPGTAVLAADTAVVLDSHILGKPDSAGDAILMLARLQGREHVVMTGVTLAGATTVVHVESTVVAMAAMSDLEIAQYVASGEPMDKAGAYAIQDVGGVFIERIDGDPWNVMGLPLPVTYRMLASAGLL